MLHYPVNYCCCFRPIFTYPFRLSIKLVIILYLEPTQGLYQAMQHSIRILFILIISFLTFPVLAADDDEQTAAPSAIYYKISEPFTINFLNQSEKQVRYLQIKVTLMSHEQESIDQAELNLPMLQDTLRTLFSEQTFEAVNTVEGRKALQASSLAEINRILKEETGKDNMDAVYFTSFILQ